MNLVLDELNTHFSWGSKAVNVCKYNVFGLFLKIYELENSYRLREDYFQQSVVLTNAHRRMHIKLCLIG